MQKNKKPVVLASAVTACVLIVVGYNALVFVPVAAALGDESLVSMQAYRKDLVSPSSIVINVTSYKLDASMADVDRALFKAAEALQKKQFKRVYLSHRGKAKYILDGGYFHEIGETYAWQNPLYLIRKLPEHVYTLEGSQAFPTYTGGWLGVMTKEIEQHNELHAGWYIND